MRKVLLLALFLGTFLPSAVCPAQTVPVFLSCSNLLGVAAPIYRIELTPLFADTANPNYFQIPDPIILSIANMPSLTNGYAATNLAVGWVYGIDISSYSQVPRKNVWLPETLTNMSGPFNLAAYQTPYFFLTNGLATQIAFEFPNEATTNILVPLLQGYWDPAGIYSNNPAGYQNAAQVASAVTAGISTGQAATFGALTATGNVSVGGNVAVVGNISAANLNTNILGNGTNGTGFMGSGGSGSTNLNIAVGGAASGTGNPGYGGTVNIAGGGTSANAGGNAGTVYLAKGGLGGYGFGPDGNVIAGNLYSTNATLTGTFTGQMNGNATSATTAGTSTNFVGSISVSQVTNFPVVVTNNEAGVTLAGSFSGTYTGTGSGLTNVSAAANNLSPYNGQTRLMPVTTKATDGLVGNFWSPLYETNSYGTNWSTQLPSTVLSNTNGTYQMDMMATTSAKNLRVLIQNSCGEVTNTATITYHVVLWDWTGTNAYPVTFNGQSTITLAPNSFAWGDCAGLCLTKGDLVYERIYYSITNGNCYASIPAGNNVFTTYASIGVWAEGYSYTVGPNYFTNIDTTLIQGQTYNPGGYIPTLGIIYGEAAATNVCIGLIGDSNFTDASSGTSGWGGFAWYPFVDFALGNNWGSQYPHINLAMSSDGLTQWYNGGSDSKSRYRRALLTGVNFFILNYQHNDFYNFGVNMPSYTNVFIAACGQLKQQFPGCKVFVDTATPSTSSTDGYLTTNNQTLNAPRDWTNANAFNFWLRSWTVFPTNNVDGVYDLDLQCEGNTNGAGIWYAFTNNVVTNCMTLSLPGFYGLGVHIGGSLWAETNGAAAFNPATFHNP